MKQLISSLNEKVRILTQRFQPQADKKAKKIKITIQKVANLCGRSSEKARDLKAKSVRSAISCSNHSPVSIQSSKVPPALSERDELPHKCLTGRESQAKVPTLRLGAI